ncbi:aldo/keto reductase [Haloimpatiens sp. FM7315]|uniref:aldo/keto reductase n=1 Tax=Haloimpatiens sp. FM7315 TaxID=3298609 RepID=UPI00397780DE
MSCKRCNKRAYRRKKIKRDEVVIATKGGYLPVDYRNILVDENYREKISDDLEKYFREDICKSLNFKNTEIDNILKRKNTINNKIIEFLFNESRINLDMDTIDIYYLHNPEVSKAGMSEEEFYNKLGVTFSFLEDKVKEGKLKYYGISTYSGFIAKETEAKYLSLEKIYKIAEKVGGDKNHFKYIQLPFNKGMDDAGRIKNQRIKGTLKTPIDAAFDLGLSVITNVSLGQGQYFYKYSCEEMIEFLVNNLRIFSSMVGMKNVLNVERNVKSIL